MNLLFKEKSWKLFVTRPATLLERAMRCLGYHRAGLQKVVSVSEHGLCQIFVDSDEWNAVEKKAVKLLYTSSGQSRLLYYKDRLKKTKKFLHVFTKTKIDGRNLRELFDHYGKITEIIIYTHLLEKAVDSQKTLRKYRHLVGYLHDTARQVIDLLYEGLLEKRSGFDIIWYFPKEVMWQNKLPKQIINARKNYYVLLSQKGKLTIWTGSQARELANLIRKASREQVKTLSLGEVAGKPAFRGKLKGKVLVIRLISDLHKIKPGMIVVSSMTEPRMNPYLRKVKAIITDEGGLTSHAAVFAREMKIPTIVGMKYATQIFKDGDLVEVDANAGIVKKI